jgi:S-adenosylmethionine-diacylglycerol 3-amino-3-carboxypropyl transferase
MALSNWLSGRMFQMVHGNNLVYNTCWEDPRLDRVALDLTPDDNVLVITSAGCNALDYALAGPNRVYAVDMNPRQNALLELKMSAARNLEYDAFFQMFGRGQLDNAREIYRGKLRSDLSDWSRSYWDRRIAFFANRRRPFYFRGTSGTFAKMLNVYIDRIVRLRPWIDEALNAVKLAEQQFIYRTYLRDEFWTRGLRFAIQRDATLSMVGVPKAQREHLQKTYEGGLVGFITSCLDAVFGELPLIDNYFWRVYLTGRYTEECCPEYLKRENFDRLRNDAVDRVRVSTNSVQGFLDKYEVPISRFVLLDHMDWLAGRHDDILQAEWQAIVNRAAPQTRILWRSGGTHTDFVDDVTVHRGGERAKMGEMLRYNRELADELHPVDRVHTYGSFSIADLAV